MKNIHLLPTDKPSRIYLIKSNNKLGITSDNPFYTENMGSGTQNQNIYITNSEEIKEGDYMLLKYEHSHGRIRKCHYIYEEQLMIDAKEDIGFGFCKRNEVYKIILTTDQDLIKDGVQAIPDEFLEWFVKNPSCEEIEVNKIYNDYGETDIFDLVCTPHSFKYKITIPKEEPKQDFPMQKLIDIMENDEELRPKQETLEEAAKKYATNHGMMAYVFPEKKESFIQGAKWQKEQDKNKYSEEEVVKLLIKFNQEIQEVEDVRGWFEQFKKK